MELDWNDLTELIFKAEIISLLLKLFKSSLVLNRMRIFNAFHMIGTFLFQDLRLLASTKLFLVAFLKIRIEQDIIGVLSLFGVFITRWHVLFLSFYFAPMIVKLVLRRKYFLALNA